MDHDEDMRSLWGAACLMHYYLNDAVLKGANEEPKREWIDGWGAMATVEFSKEFATVRINFYETGQAKGIGPSLRVFLVAPFTVDQVAQLARSAAGPNFTESVTLQIFQERLAKQDPRIRELWQGWLDLCICPISNLRDAMATYQGGSFTAIEELCPVHFNLFTNYHSTSRLVGIENPSELEVIRRLQQQHGGGAA